MQTTILEEYRAAYQAKIPKELRAEHPEPKYTQAPAYPPEVVALFPNTSGLKPVRYTGGIRSANPEPIRVGVLLSGGPAPGGHNVIAGIFDGLKAIHPDSTLFGFYGGPDGLLKNQGLELEQDRIDHYRNSGGFDMIRSGRTKLETQDDFTDALETAAQRNLDGLIVVGGDDSNTNALTLAEFARKEGAPLVVTGVPKTIDGDLKNESIQTSFGFDTATKIYCELIGNIQRDIRSTHKYWHFIRLMGRSASNIALECALQTQPNLAFIAEEVAERNMTLHDVVDEIVQLICQRTEEGKPYGTVLVPEGLIEFIPEMRTLVQELNDILAIDQKEFNALTTFPHKRQYIGERLSPHSSGLYRRLPREIATQLILDRDPHGNVQVARIDTERLLLELVELRLNEFRERGYYHGKFAAQHHYLGYEGRCAPPSNFDADYCYALGRASALLQRDGLSGYMATISDLQKPATNWIVGGFPLSAMVGIERRDGKDKPVITKALVDLDGPVFQSFAAQRSEWHLEDRYRHPGPIQYFGPPEVCDRITITLELESHAEQPFVPA